MNFTVVITSSQVIDIVIRVFLLFFPESKVLLQELDDTLGVAEVFLFKFVDLVKSFLESLVGKVAGGLVILHDFVMEDRGVEGKTELDWVAWSKSNSVSFFVSLESLLFDFFELSSLGILSNVTVVVTNHFDKESLGFSVACFGKNLLLNHLNNSLAVTSELVLNLLFVVSKGGAEL